MNPESTSAAGSGAAGWASQMAWCILHTCFDHGTHFLQTWAAWRGDPLRPRMLHYVALTPGVADLQAASPPDQYPAQDDFALALYQQCRDLDPGQHRLCFEDGRVLLTLCIGPVQVMLREQRFEADAVVLAHPPVEPELPGLWDSWAVKALARCCRRGTQLELLNPTPGVRSSLQQCGFEFAASAMNPSQVQCGVFNPRWELKTTREPWRLARAAAQRCAVIGAGLAGASVAASLARRGWQVEVFDQAPTPAAGASGLPVGLAAPHVSVDDCHLSQLSRSGIRLCLQQASTMLRLGQDWQPSGVLEHLFDNTGSQPPPPRQHRQAGWIKPAALVRAWLAQAGVCFHGGTAVHGLQRDAQGWSLLDAAGHVLACAARVVLANATGARPLLERTQALQPALNLGLGQLPAVYGVRGLVSWAVHDTPEPRPFPQGPVNGNGSLIPFIPFDGELRWFLGASYQPMGKPEWPDDKNHGANVLRLEKMEPALFASLTPVFEAGALNAWKGVRCVTADRLPLVGSVQQEDQSLWICAGMGSRGLSHAPLCAEWLAAQWAGEPWPVQASLANSLQAQRHRVQVPR